MTLGKTLPIFFFLQLMPSPFFCHTSISFRDCAYDFAPDSPRACNAVLPISLAFAEKNTVDCKGGGTSSRGLLPRSYPREPYQYRPDWILWNRQSPYEGYEATLTYDPVNERAILFGGVFCDNNHCYYGDFTWSLRLDTGSEAWQQLSFSDKPPYRDEHSAVYDSQRSRLVVFGGEQSLSEYVKDVWSLDLSYGREVWNELSPQGIVAPKISRHSSVYDSNRDRMIVLFGAQQNFGNPFYRNTHELLVLDFSRSPDGEWKTLFPQGPFPAPREGAVAVFDPIEDEVIAFGGYGDDGELNDAWALDFSSSEAGQWAKLDPTGDVPGPRWNAAGTYDPIHQMLILFGGVNIHQGKSYNDLYVMSTVSGNPRWIRLDPQGIAPDERGHHQVIYDQMNLRPIIYGGGLNQYGYLTDTKTDAQTVGLDNGSLCWERIKVSGEQRREYYGEMVSIYDPIRDRVIVHGGIRSPFGPSIFEEEVFDIDFVSGRPQWHFHGHSGIHRSNHRAIYDELNDRMVFFGGQDGTNDPINKVHYLDLSSEEDEWHTLDLPNPPMQTLMVGHSAVYDPIGQRMLVFGGAISPDFIENNDVWALDLKLGQEAWYRVIPGGVPPHPRQLHSAIYDPREHRMVVYGGFDDFPLDDVWALDLAEGQETWTELATFGETPPPHYDHDAVYDPNLDRMIVFGGLTGDNVLYALDLGTLEWTELDPVNENPPPQDAMNLIYDPVRDRVILLSGNKEGDRSDDTYYLLNLGF